MAQVAINVLAIDPGTRSSGVVVLRPRADAPPELGMVCAAMSNEELVSWLGHLSAGGGHVVVIEEVECFGMAVGREVFETVHWAGRFHQAALPLPVHMLGRKEVKLHLCQTHRAKDPNVRQALLDLYGGSEAVGRKASPGPLYGVSKHAWSALALGVTWLAEHA